MFDNGLVVPFEGTYHLPVFLGFPSVPAARWWHNQISPALPGNSGPVFMERSFTYDARLGNVQPGTTVLGFFQSWRYFDDCSAEIRERMSRLPSRRTGTSRCARRFSRAQGTSGCTFDVVITCCRNSRKSRVSPRGLLSKVNCVPAEDGDRRARVRATDSPDVVRKEFEGMGEFVLIDPPPGCHPFEVVLILSRVDGLVTANSSFSWWAGFIGERTGRVVIAPRPWLTQTNIDTRDLLPPDWLTVDRDG